MGVKWVWNGCGMIKDGRGEMEKRRDEKGRQLEADAFRHLSIKHPNGIC